MGKLALPGVRHHSSSGLELVSPYELRTLNAASSRELPLRLGGNLFARPRGVSFSVLECYVHNRMSGESLQRAFGTVRVTPVRAWNVGPPIEMIPKIDSLPGIPKHD